jgi:uncharacterized membrane protein YesL
MIDASKNLWESLKNAFHELGQLVLLNLMWLVCSLAIITLPAATAALAYATRQLIYDPSEYDLKVYFQGFKSVFWWSWRWFLPNLILTILFLFNILFFRAEDRTFTIFIMASNIVLLFTWWFLQSFILPFMVAQEKPSFRLAIRNSLVILVKYPWHFLLITLFLWLFAILSALLMMPWVLFSVSFSLFVTIHFLQQILEPKPKEEAGE